MFFKGFQKNSLSVAKGDSSPIGGAYLKDGFMQKGIYKGAKMVYNGGNKTFIEVKYVSDKAGLYRLP